METAVQLRDLEAQLADQGKELAAATARKEELREVKLDS
jgi:hypothetical protein